jgi:hypothetical protein
MIAIQGGYLLPKTKQMTADRALFNRLLRAIAKGEPLPRGTFPEAQKSSRKGTGAGYGDARTLAGEFAGACSRLFITLRRVAVRVSSV